MFGFFRRPRRATSAETAKERLQILLAHERIDRTGPDYLPLLQRDILEVIKRYIRADDDRVDIKLERGKEISTLEINIELPGARALQARGAA
jgi:cell division topological specificity factor